MGDVTAGYRFADWFALHGFQATLTSMAQEFERDLVELHPDVIVIGFQSLSPIQQAVPRVRSSCPQVPIIAIIDNSLDRRGEGSGSAFMKTFCSDLFMCRTFDPPSKSS
ncbi:MAG: putative Transcriptional regulator, CheY-like [Nitrospira sp.]|jgi:hypothetical protein|nr:putative Transcriptional regulator, CheY-like [Nitrospira sp.]